MIVVSDTTPLNYLILIDSVDVLPALFGRVYAPSAVIRELAHPRSPEPVRRWADSPPAWLAVQEPTRIDPSLRLGPGEAAAIALAEELAADWVLMDERRGSREAERRGFRVAGTLVIIEEAGANNLLDYDEARNRLVAETNFYVTDDVLRASEQRFRARKLVQEPTEPKQGPSIMTGD
jgi:predicted nucleic acid-binding protein